MGWVRLPIVAVFGIAFTLLAFVAGFALGQATADRRAPTPNAASSVTDPYPTFTLAPTALPPAAPRLADTPRPTLIATAIALPVLTSTPLPSPTMMRSPTRLATRAPSATRSPTPGPGTKTLQFRLAPRQVHVEELPLPAGATIAGSFTVRADDVNFSFWLGGAHRVRLFGRTNVGGTFRFSFVAPTAGTYALAFDNASPPARDREISLTYTVKDP